MTYEDVLSRFRISRRYKYTAKCFCPAHSDGKASLSVSRGKKQETVIHCNAGCSVEDVLAAVGLTKKDLCIGDDMGSDQISKGDSEKQNQGSWDGWQTFSSWQQYMKKKNSADVEAVYHYYNMSGEYEFTRFRMNPKDFRYGMYRKGNEKNFRGDLNGQKRAEIPAMYAADFQELKKAAEQGQRIFYVEGEKDVNTLHQNGYQACTCGGAEDWIPECSPFFKGADVVILADNDDPGKKLANAVHNDLKQYAKSVKIIVPTPDIPKGDVSDFFKDHSVTDFEKLLEDAEPVEAKPEIDLWQFMYKDESNHVKINDYKILQYIEENEDIFILGGIPYIYSHGVYRVDRTGTRLKTMIRDLLLEEYKRFPTVKRIYDLIVTDDNIQASAEDLNHYPVHWISFRNGFYDPLQKKLIPHHPKYKNTIMLPHTYDPEGKIKGHMVQKWLEFICNEEDREMLLQYAGLCLTRDTRQQKFLILNGEGGTGKSIVIRMIDAMIGSENISNISLHQLTQRFAAYGLLNKLLNSCADLETDALSDVSILKKILGEDTLSAEAKGKDAISFKSFAKLVFSTNELPLIKTEKTNGFYRRLLILTMNKVPENRQTDFFDKLSAEIGDFIRLSVEALSRMYQNGTIKESAGSVEAVKRLRCESDTVESFLESRVEIVPDSAAYRVKREQFYLDYEAYCREEERMPLVKHEFYRSIKMKGIGEVKNASGVRMFKGIKIKTADELLSSAVKPAVNEWMQAEWTF